MAEMVRYGLLANPYTPGVLIDFYGNPLSGAGSGWPTVNGSGPGNLQAETAIGDAVGYNFTDNGTGGFTVETAGTGAINLSDDAHGLFLQSTSVDGINLSAQNVIVITTAGNTAGYGVSLVDTDSDLGLLLQSAGTSNGGIALQVANGSGPLTIEHGGSGGIDIEPGSGGMTGVLSEVAGSLGSPVGGTGATTFVTAMTTPSLAVGKWRFTVIGALSVAGATGSQLRVVEGTATATFAGVTGAGRTDQATGVNSDQVSLSFIATVTVAGTLEIQFAGPSGNTLLAAAGASTLANVTGYTGVRIA